MQRSPVSQALRAGRFIGGVFGLIFLGIGLTVIIFLWSDTDGFGSPPIFFRIFGSFIALGFVAFGGTMAYGALTGGGFGAENLDVLQSNAQRPPSTSRDAGTRAGYACPSCGAALAQNADVSPLGDVKCTHCGAWFNIHGNS